MSDRPILFSGPMVQAILAGRKTQTRRVLKPQKGVTLAELEWEPAQGGVGNLGRVPVEKLVVPYAVGDRLWVREPVWFDPEWNDYPGYVADHGGDVPVRWRKKPGIFMPLSVSRITLTVTDVRVQRVQDISEADALAEGVGNDPPGRPALVQFFGLWDSLNASRGFDWEANPWVVALTFKAAHRNIDG